jgi:hypothetical protein
MTDPPGWGTEFMSSFFEAAHHNNKAASVNLKLAWEHLSAISGLFDKVNDNLTNVQPWLPVHFMIDTFSCYLAGIRLATSGQIRPAYMVLRGCLESSLYGLHIAQDEEGKAVTWLNREVDEAALKAVRKEFSVGNVMATLARIDPQTAKAASDLYERTITYGGHPNPYSILSISAQKDEAAKTTHLQDVLSRDCPAMRLCLKTTAEVGLCSLHVFLNVYRQRFDILGITDKLVELRSPKWFQAYKVPLTSSRRDSSLRSE